MKRDADLAEESDRRIDGERAQDAADDRGPAAPEVALRDDPVGDVAARTAADEDFCAGRARAIENDDRALWIGPAGKNRGGETGGAGADDGDVRSVAVVQLDAHPVERVAQAIGRRRLRLAPLARSR